MIDRTKAADILWTLCGAETYALLVVRRRWPVDGFGDWIFDVLVEQLVRPAVTGRPHETLGGAE